MFRRSVLCACALGVLGVSVLGDTPAPDEALDVSQIISMVTAGGTSKPAAAAGAFPKFEDVTKGMKAQKGLFTLWSYPKSAKDKDSEKLLAQIPAGFLGEQFMLSISYSGGGYMTGFPLEERVVRWEVLDKQLLLVEPESHYVIDKSKTVSDVVSRTYPERIRVACPIVTKSSSGDPVIDLGPLLKSDFAGIAWMSFGRGGGVNASLSKWTKRKSFELNVEIGVALATSRMYPSGSYDKKLVHFSFWKLPKSDYTPRVADDRVGYFLTANQDWSKPTEARDLFNRYVDRWHLVKRDTSLSVCEPKQPIVFYIEKTVPVRFRKAVRDGILEWNKAFEKIGFVSAVQVRQQTVDNEWKDLDPEDMRYSFFRWIVTGAGFAMGPHRSNPFTGQIYDADIIFDDSMVRYFEQSADRMLPSALAATKAQDPALQDFLDAHPQWNPPEREWGGHSLADPSDKELRKGVRQWMRDRGHMYCDYAGGMKHQMAVGRAMLEGQPKEVMEKFLYDTIKEVVMHEVGHTLGLRHNFKASTVYSIEEIKKRRGTGEPTVGSVMDYNPVLFFSENAIEGHFLTPTIGPYDEWAIEYGYRPADGSYKADASPSKSDDKDDGDDDLDDDDDAKPEDSASIKVEVGGVEVPAELLEQIPADLRKMIASGGISMGGGVSKAAAGPSFKGADSSEAGMLRAIASRSAEPLLAYSTDEDTTFFGPDPRSNRFDMGDDPIAWARERVALIDSRLGSILEWSVKDGESWYHMRQAFVSLMLEKAFVLDYVGKYIGGQYTSRSHRSDPNSKAPFELVDAATQREALTFIEKHLFSDDYLSVSPEVLNHLAVPRWYHQGAYVDYMVDFPIHNLISVLQWWNMFDRLFPNTLRRIYDAEMKTDGNNKLTVAEYLRRVQNGCWSVSLGSTPKAGTDDAPAIPSVRRSLQRAYLTVMEPLVRTAPGRVLPPDLHAMAQYSLARLKARIHQQLTKRGKKLDFASRAHLVSCRSRIERMLAPDLKEY
jgi:Met-zincin/Domain of unknown function (DUF5117)